MIPGALLVVQRASYLWPEMAWKRTPLTLTAAPWVAGLWERRLSPGTNGLVVSRFVSSNVSINNDVVQLLVDGWLGFTWAWAFLTPERDTSSGLTPKDTDRDASSHR